MQTLSISVDEEILAQATPVIEDMGLTLSSAIQVFLKKVAREQSIDFVLIRRDLPFSPAPSPEQSINEKEEPARGAYPAPTVESAIKTDRGEMRKRLAVNMFRAKGATLYGTITFSSKNRTTFNYWSNPNFDYLNEDWSLILNDWINRKLYLFQIPRNSISYTELVGRNDQPNLIDLQIYENDPNFTDMRSGYSFKRFLVDEIDY